MNQGNNQTNNGQEPNMSYNPNMAPFWDFIAELEQGARSHPWFGGRGGPQRGPGRAAQRGPAHEHNEQPNPWMAGFPFGPMPHRHRQGFGPGRRGGHRHHRGEHHGPHEEPRVMTPDSEKEIETEKVLFEQPNPETLNEKSETEKPRGPGARRGGPGGRGGRGMGPGRARRAAALAREAQATEEAAPMQSDSEKTVSGDEKPRGPGARGRGRGGPGMGRGGPRRRQMMAARAMHEEMMANPYWAAFWPYAAQFGPHAGPRGLGMGRGRGLGARPQGAPGAQRGGPGCRGGRGNGAGRGRGGQEGQTRGPGPRRMAKLRELGLVAPETEDQNVLQKNENKNKKNKNGKWHPKVDVFDHPEAFVVHASLPGAKKEDVEVNFNTERSVLIISGNVKRPGDEDFLKTITTSERKVGDFIKRVRLGNNANPAQVDVDEITAKVEDGVLRIEVPKTVSGFVEVKNVNIN